MKKFQWLRETLLCSFVDGALAGILFGCATFSFKAGLIFGIIFALISVLVVTVFHCFTATASETKL